MAKLSSVKRLEARIRVILKANPNMLVPYYLMGCYCYYVLDDPAFSDKLFDEITAELLSKWETIKHYHKHIITLEDLEAGTGFALKYPEITKDAAHNLLLKSKGLAPL